MPRFKGSAQGTRGGTSRLGTTRMETNCDAYRVGIKCIAEIGRFGMSVINVYATGGSKGKLTDVPVHIGHLDSSGSFIVEVSKPEVI